MLYSIELTPRAADEFSALPANIQKRIDRWFDLLAENPYREGTKKLESKDDLYRVHAGRDYVVVYRIENAKLLVLIVRVAHRKDVYRHLA